jgi:allophanate hydrolase subunit 2
VTNRQDVDRQTVEVVRPGALTTVQDSGRPGFAHLGVPASGALDSDAYARANRLVGNAETAAVLESTVDGVSLRFDAPAVIAVTGARATVLVDGRLEVWSLPVYVPAGSLVDVEIGRAHV